jgi:thiamine biosynthesis protein ThiS
MITITVNGNAKPLGAPMSVQQLLDALGLESVRVAVELNRAILPKNRFADTPLKEGDSLEIVQFVGGG